MSHVQITRAVRSKHAPDHAIAASAVIARYLGWAVVRDAPGRVELWAEGALSELRSSCTATVTAEPSDGGTVITLLVCASWLQLLPRSRVRDRADVLAAAMRDPARAAEAPLPRTRDQRAISGLTTALFIVAIVLALAIGLPHVGTAHSEQVHLPAVALGSVVIYRLEIALAVLYGGLLLLVPLYRGAVRGDLPIEVSARGAKYEQVGATVSEIGEQVEKLDKRVNQIAIDFSLKAAAPEDPLAAEASAANQESS